MEGANNSRQDPSAGQGRSFNEQGLRQRESEGASWEELPHQSENRLSYHHNDVMDPARRQVRDHKYLSTTQQRNATEQSRVETTSLGTSFPSLKRPTSKSIFAPLSAQQETLISRKRSFSLYEEEESQPPQRKRYELAPSKNRDISYVVPPPSHQACVSTAVPLVHNKKASGLESDGSSSDEAFSSKVASSSSRRPVELCLYTGLVLLVFENLSVASEATEMSGQRIKERIKEGPVQHKRFFYRYSDVQAPKLYRNPRTEPRAFVERQGHSPHLARASEYVDDDSTESSPPGIMSPSPASKRRKHSELATASPHPTGRSNGISCDSSRTNMPSSNVKLNRVSSNFSPTQAKYSQSKESEAARTSLSDAQAVRYRDGNSHDRDSAHKAISNLPVLKFCPRTNRLVMHFRSIGAAASSINADPFKLKHAIESNKMPFSGFVWRFAEDKSPSHTPNPPRSSFEEFKPHAQISGPHTPRKIIQKICPDSGDVVEVFPSRAAAARSLGIKYHLFHRESQNEEKPFMNYFWRIGSRESLSRRKRRAVEVVDLGSMKVVGTYTTQIQAAAERGMSTSQVNYIMRKAPCVKGGLLWRYAACSAPKDGNSKKTADNDDGSYSSYGSDDDNAAQGDASIYSLRDETGADDRLLVREVTVRKQLKDVDNAEDGTRSARDGPADVVNRSDPIEDESLINRAENTDQKTQRPTDENDNPDDGVSKTNVRSGHGDRKEMKLEPTAFPQGEGAAS